MAISYTAVSFNPNSWDAQGINEIVADCGHKHRTLLQAAKCIKRTWSGNGQPSTLMLHTQVRDSDNNPVGYYWESQNSVVRD
jgi:hypothetical protein